MSLPVSSAYSSSADPRSVSALNANNPVNVLLLAAENSLAASTLAQLTASQHPLRILHRAEQLTQELDSESTELPDIVLVSVDAIADRAGQFIDAFKSRLDAWSIPILLLAEPSSGVDSNATLLDAMAAGAQDFISLPIDTALLEAKIAAQLRNSQIQRTVQQQHQLIAENHDHLIHEQQLAKEVFDKVARDNGVDMANIRHWLSPIAVFNGDVLLAAPTPNGGLVVLLGDFTGHGLAAAIGAIPLASTFYGMVEKGFTMQDIIKELNNKLYQLLPVSLFCCASMAQFNFEQGSVDIWNAGLPDCYILRKGSPVVEVVSSNALALGIVGGNSFDAQPTRFHMASGDRLYFLSDGVLEATNSAGEQFGDQRLKDAIAEQHSKDAQSGFSAIKQSVEAFIGEHSRADDISLVEISMVDAADFASMFESGKGHRSDDPVSWRFQYEARPASLQYQDPVPLLLHILLEVPNLRKYSGQLFTIISELYNNALDHGLLGLASGLKQQPDGFAQYYEMRQQRLRELDSGSVSFNLDYQGDAKAGELIVEVIDTGDGFNHEALLAQLNPVDVNSTDVDGNSAVASLDNLHGRGVKLLQSVCHKVEYLGCGNHVRVEFHWSS